MLVALYVGSVCVKAPLHCIVRQPGAAIVIMTRAKEKVDVVKRMTGINREKVGVVLWDDKIFNCNMGNCLSFF